MPLLNVNRCVRTKVSPIVTVFMDTAKGEIDDVVEIEGTVNCLPTHISPYKEILIRDV